MGRSTARVHPRNAKRYAAQGVVVIAITPETEDVLEGALEVLERHQENQAVTNVLALMEHGALPMAPVQNLRHDLHALEQNLTHVAALLKQGDPNLEHFVTAGTHLDVVRLKHCGRLLDRALANAGVLFRPADA